MIWKAKRLRDRRRWADATQRRSGRPERLEGRRLLAADPIHVGIVYLETDYLESDLDIGGDSRGDRFILSFVGGAPDTELNELRIRTDKDGDGITVGDPIFDTEQGGRGKNGAHGFQVVRVQTSDGRQIDAVAEVEDGSQELVLRLSNFRAGDRLEFTVDVDEVLRNAIDLAVFNDRLDVITSGQEFQDSILEATFNAPHYEVSQADAIFLNDYGTPSEATGINLPPDESNDVDSRPNRSAAAVATTVQVPKPVSISGHVWVDNDLDETREADEPRLAEVEIALWKLDSTSGQFVDTGHTARTDDNGRYVFPKSLGLSPGQYRVVESQPQGWYSVAAVPGTVDGVISGQVESPDAISSIDLPLGDLSAINYDFAEAQPASLSGYVYLDGDNNGRRDSIETGIAGVRVQLVPIHTLAPQSVLTVTTAADGSYSFTGLAPGSYEVIEIDQPADLNDGFDAAGTVNGQIVGVAENPGDHIREIVLAGNDAGIEYNFGELALGSLAGFVYLAAPGEDCTGHHDGPGNTPLVDVQVALQTELGETIARTSTGADGGYQFDQLPVGNYRILQFTPSGLIDGNAHVGRIDGVQVGTAAGGGLIQGITLTASGIGVEYNFCEAAPASISGYVYEDHSDDGSRDDGESGIAGTTVTLVNADGSIAATTQTDASGRYEFAGILPGDYTIVEQQPRDYFDGIDTPGTVRGRRVGRVADENDTLTSVVVNQGDEAVEYNFGELIGATLAGRVHSDLDGDCELDADEQPLAGVRIRLLNEAGAEVAETTTDVTGRYIFSDLAPGRYTVVELQPAGFFDGDARAGSAGGNVENGGRIADIVLAPGEFAVDYNFCEHPPAEIIGSVFGDQDGDCLFDADESGIGGVQVELYDESGRLVATTTTGPNGQYRFSHLPAGEYMVREIQPNGWLHGGQIAGSAGGDDSVADVISRIPVNWGQRLTQYNFCEVAPATISGVVFVDGNGDCLRDADEMSLEGVTIELRDASGNRVAVTSTDANGRYSFDGLTPGQYEIFELQPEGYFQGGQSVGTGGGSVVGADRLALTLLAGRDVADYNFCEIGPASISGWVYVDDDGDCIRDAHESGLEGVTIELRDRDGNRVAQTTTDASGNYQFNGLPPGQYEIFELQPDGFFHGSQQLGSSGGEVLGDDRLALTLLGSTDAVDYNFCEIGPASISGIVYVDDDGDCIRDAHESGLEGVTIELRDRDGNRVAQTTTDAGGNYQFNGLAPGDYEIFELQPDGFFQGSQQLGSAGGEVLGEDLLALTLLGGTDAVDYNFCEIGPASISGIVYVDDDGDCIRDAHESGLEGVTIELRDRDGNRVAQTTTDAGGNYQFNGLAPGDYEIFELQPDGFFQGSQQTGSAGGEVLGEDLLALTLLGGTDVVDYNFCEIAPSSIAGGVWQESDTDQVFDPGEDPIPGVIVELIDDVGDIVAQKTTDADGQYRFESLAPGVYSVRETQPSSFFHGGQVVGSVGGRVAADDLIVGITLTGGTHAVDYDFPEVPPARISGFVFQDGEPITLSEHPDPTELRQFKDGQQSDDDVPLAGVVMELRNILGRPFTADRALPGVYPDGPIQTITDSDGFYQFVGLRPGTYHVYQVQPDEFVDGLDTPGTTGGLAVNPADEVDDPDDQIMIQTLALNEETDPRNDAILNISLVGGGESVLNNFSEIVIEEPQLVQVAPPPPREIPDVYVPVPQAIESFIRVTTFSAASPAVRGPMIAVDEWAVSWHLSLINGGFPRGEDATTGVLGVSARQMQQNWSDGEHTGGRWTIVTREGKRVPLSKAMTLGEEDAIALTGDFNGDGADEPAIYVGGQWFVDLNGNGIWDVGDLWIQLGTEMDRPVVGDWDGDGKDDIGIFGRQWQRDPQRIIRDPGLPDPDNVRRRQVDPQQLAARHADRGQDRHRLLRRGNEGSLRADAVDHVFQYGEQVDTPVSGDWNGDGIDQIAVFRSGQWLLDVDGDGRWTRRDDAVEFGRPGDEPIIGDFNGDGIDEIGVVRGDVWIIDIDGDRKITANDLRIVVPRESGDSQPVVGDFDGDGKDEPGYYDEAA